jgi:hypothetical protein
MKDLQEFATAKLAEEGVLIPLRNVEGKITEHWIKIRGTDSSHFKKAQTSFRRKVLLLNELQEQKETIENTLKIETETRKLLASLVVDWSFKNDDGTPYKCNQSNIVKVLADAPILAQEIDQVSARRKNFINRSLEKSSDLQVRNSSSKKHQKKAKLAN